MLNEAELVSRTLGRLRGEDDTPIWTPFEDSPQSQAYSSEADEIGFGGAAGGGKTALGVGMATTRHRQSVIFRREYTQHKEIIRYGNQVLRGRCRFVFGEKRAWTLPAGRVIEVGAVQHEGDLDKWQGRPHDLIVIDEAAQWPENWVRYLAGWLRTDDPTQTTKLLLTFNPPQTEEGAWIIDYFAPWLDENHANPAVPGELRWVARVDDEDEWVDGPEPVTDSMGETLYPKSRTFIPARVEDNPVYVSTDYIRQLNALPEPLRSQLRYGDFSIKPTDDIWQVIPTAWVLEAQRRWEEGIRPEVTLRAVGVDVARGGGDNTTIAKIYGTWFDELHVYAGTQTPDGATAANLVERAMEIKAPLGVDVIGYGASCYDHLVALQMSPTPINFGAGSDQVDKSGRYGFANLRAEAWWRFREALDPDSGENIALPPGRHIRNDLCSVRFKVVGAKYKLESKDDVRKRLGRSPDLGDAIVIAWLMALRSVFTMPIILDW